MPNRVYRHSGIWLDVANRMVHIFGRAVKVTNRETQILELLFTQPGRVYRREEFLDVFMPQILFLRTVDMYVIHLRTKLFPDNLALGKVVLRSVRGVGYQLPDRKDLVKRLDELIMDRQLSAANSQLVAI